MQTFGPLLESFLQDEFQEVQLQVLGNLHKLSQIDELRARIDSLRIEQQEDRSNLSETAKILNPEKTVILPDLDAGCSLADSAPPNEFRKWS